MRMRFQNVHCSWRAGFLALLLALVSWSTAQNTGTRLEPDHGMLVGIFQEENYHNIFSSDAAMNNYISQTGWDHAVYLKFADIPLTDAGRTSITNYLDRLAKFGALALISLEPVGGYDTVTQVATDEVAQLCARFEPGTYVGGPGTACMIRYALEMNGPFHPPWGFRPLAFRQTFCRMTQSIRTYTKNSVTIWGPNNALGYPLSGPASIGMNNATELAAMDTNGNGIIDSGDDPFSPWWPGANCVDWVGLTAKQWDTNANTLAPIGHLATQLDQNDFYGKYCRDANKPLVLPDTGATYLPDNGGDGFDMKTSWYIQVYNVGANYNFAGVTQHTVPYQTGGTVNPGVPNILARYPKLKMANVYNTKVYEFGGTVFIDWRLYIPVSDVNTKDLIQIPANEPNAVSRDLLAFWIAMIENVNPAGETEPYFIDRLSMQSKAILANSTRCTSNGILVDDYEVAARFTGRTNALNGWFGSGTGITIGRVTTPSNQLSLQATSATGNWFATNLASTTCYDGRSTPYVFFQVTPPVSPATFTVEIQLRNAACTAPDFTLSKFWTVTTSGTNPQIISLNLLDAGKFAVTDLSRLQGIAFSGLPITATPFLFDNIRISSCPCATVFVDDYESAANFAAAQNLRGGWLGVGADMTMARVTSPSNKLSLRRTGAGTGNWFATNFSPAGCYDGRATPFLSFEVTAPVAPTTLNVQVQLRNAACTATDFTLSQTWPISLDSTTPRTITINLLERFAVASLARLQAVSFVAFPTTAGPFLFDNIQLQSGSTCSATIPSTPPVTPPPCTTVLVDDFVPDAQYNVNHLNDRGGWTNDDGTLGLNSVANSVLSLTPNGAPDYWYSSVLVNNACLDASATPILEIVAAASVAASFQVEVQIRSACTSAGTITRYSFPLSVTTSFTVYRIDLTTQIPVASLSRVGAISLVGPWTGPVGTTSYFIDRIMFISSTTSCAPPSTSARLRRDEL